MSAPVFGVIAPHPPIMVDEVGGSRSKVTDSSLQSIHEAATMLERFDPDTVVIMSPHAPAVADAFAVETASHLEGSFAQFGAPAAHFEYRGDPELAHALLQRLHDAGIPAIDRAEEPRLASGGLDHGVLVPMSFLDPDGRWPLLVLSLSWLPYELHRRLGAQLAEAADSLGRRIAFVASGDCSHRLSPDAPAGFSPRGKEFDAELVELLGTSNFRGLMYMDPDLVEAAGECGLRSFVTMGGVVGDEASSRVLSYEGPWGVGYLTAVVNEAAVGSPTPESGAKGGMPGDDESEIVRLARRTIETYVKTGEVPHPEPLSDPGLPKRSGAFVCLHWSNDLRGCIGTISAVRPTLAEEVVRNAIDASTRDPRFPPVDPSELDELDISVDVLHEAEPATIEDLDPSRYGVIVTSGYKRGLLLPDLEGVDTVQEQVAIAKRKAGIAPGEPATLERFRVDRYT